MQRKASPPHGRRIPPICTYHLLPPRPSWRGSHVSHIHTLFSTVLFLRLVTLSKPCILLESRESTFLTLAGEGSFGVGLTLVSPFHVLGDNAVQSAVRREGGNSLFGIRSLFVIIFLYCFSLFFSLFLFFPILYAPCIYINIYPFSFVKKRKMLALSSMIKPFISLDFFSYLSNYHFSPSWFFYSKQLDNLTTNNDKANSNNKTQQPFPRATQPPSRTSSRLLHYKTLCVLYIHGL